MVVFGEAGLISAFRLSQENARFEQRIHRLERDNENLKENIEHISKSPAFLERTIRKNLSLLAQDEMIFEFQD